MIYNNIPDIILQETKHLPDDLLKEVLDFRTCLKFQSWVSCQNDTTKGQLYKSYSGS
jgi:hypothetical protein